MNNLFRRPGLLVMAILCFVLPFCNVSCSVNGNKMPIGTVSGFDLVLGKQFQKPDNDGVVENKDVTVQSNWAMLAFLAALLGSISYFFKVGDELKRKWNKYASLFGSICLFFLCMFSEAWYRTIKNLPLILDFRFGFYLCWILFIGSTVINWRKQPSPSMAIDSDDTFKQTL